MVHVCSVAVHRWNQSASGCRILRMASMQLLNLHKQGAPTNFKRAQLSLKLIKIVSASQLQLVPASCVNARQLILTAGLTLTQKKKKKKRDNMRRGQTRPQNVRSLLWYFGLSFIVHVGRVMQPFVVRSRANIFTVVDYNKDVMGESLYFFKIISLSH